ncbi:hypothetical protein HOG48_00275 [Candidatus Peregrinibacteria bacterium]|jgi:sugar-specific transcriptional regulator TrmB|nr:hypothetical protein [Candidatus Peregrinibacteria bacterium]
MISSADLNRIGVQFKMFGCADRETQIYIQALKMGACSVQDIAKKLKQNRVTVHSAIESLIEKGFLTGTRKGKKRLIVAEEPDVLYQLIQRKKNEISLIESNVDYAVKLLQSMRSEEVGKPSVKFYEGVEGFKKMLEESLSSKGEMLVFSNVEMLAELVDSDYLENYFGRRAGKGINTRLIFPDCKFAKKVNENSKKYKIEIRLLSGSVKWSSAFFLWNNTVAFLSYTEGRLTTTFIENPDIAYFVRTILFDRIWFGLDAPNPQ